MCRLPNHPPLPPPSLYFGKSNVSSLTALFSFFCKPIPFPPLWFGVETRYNPLWSRLCGFGWKNQEGGYKTQAKIKKCNCTKFRKVAYSTPVRSQVCVCVSNQQQQANLTPRLIWLRRKKKRLDKVTRHCQSALFRHELERERAFEE